MALKQLFASLLLLNVFCGCSEYGYRYQPHPQDWSNLVFADYRIDGDTIDILVDTNGFMLQKVSILKADGMFAKPTSIDYPQFEDELLQGNGILIHGPKLAQGPTIAHFNKAEIGSPPWEVHLDIQEMHPVI